MEAIWDIYRLGNDEERVETALTLGVASDPVDMVAEKFKFSYWT
jgi:hypothetical protein